MSLTDEHLRIAARIDARVREVDRDGANEVAILMHLYDDMPDFKHLMDTAQSGDMDELCVRFHGFHLFTTIIGALAAGIGAGEISVPPPTQPPNLPKPVAKPLRPLTLNKRFMYAFLEADAPCFALGLAEEEGRPYAFLALRPSIPVPPETFAPGFAFGHSLRGNDHFEVLHFAFAFYEFHTYNALVNPNNPIVRTVLDAMLANGEYFFFAIDARDGKATAFRADIEQTNLAGIENNRARIAQSTTSEEQYRRAAAQFARNPDPPGTLLAWVCRDDIGYLDLTRDRFTLTPATESRPGA